MGSSLANIVDDVENTFNQSGFDTIRCDLAVPRCCFDIFAYQLAENFHRAIITKVIHNIDGLSSKHIIEINAIAKFLDALPIVIGDSNRRNKLAEDTLYFRMKKQITAISRSTLRNMLVENTEPYLIATRGSFNTRIDGDKLRKKRKELNISRKYLSEKVGISTKTISDYERGGISNSNIDHVKNIERLIGADLSIPIDILSYYETEIKTDDLPQNKPKYKKDKASLADDIEDLFEELEISHFWTHSSPFDILLKMPVGSKRQSSTSFPIISLIFPEVDEKDKRKLNLIRRLLTVLKVYGTAIVDDEVDAKKFKVAGFTPIRKKELKDVRDTRELSKLVRKKQINQ